MNPVAERRRIYGTARQGSSLGVSRDSDGRTWRSDENRPAPRRAAAVSWITGAWVCQSCGAAVTELPFDPAAQPKRVIRCSPCARAGRPTA